MPAGARKAVLVSGATSGIGEACTVALLAAGFEVFAGYRKKAEAARLRKLGATPLSLDVTSAKSVRAAAARVKHLFALVNNAGVTLTAPLEAVSVPQLRALFEVNVLGVVALTQALLPRLRESRGRVVNIGSLSGLLAAPFMGPYCASKAALESLSDSLRMELAPFGVEVSVVEPGPTQSLVWKKSVAARPKLRKASPASARAAYEKSWTRFDALVQSAADRAGPVARVTDAVLDALTAAEPKTRYVLDDGQSLRLAALPDRERDAKLLSGFGLPGRK